MNQIQSIFQITFSYSNNLAENYKSAKGTIYDLESVVKTKINYSPFSYDDNYRKEINSDLKKCNCIMLDFDDNVLIEDITKQFKNVFFLFATTKSHQKEKNGIICDRFRLILPLKEYLDITIDEYKMMMDTIIKRYGADKSCKDISRFYYGYENSETFINFGEFFNIKSILKQSKFLYEYNNQQKQIQKETKLNFQVPQKQYQNSCETKMEWFYKYSHTQQMLNYFEFDKRFGAGGRNTYLFGVAKHFQEHGCDSDFIKYEVLWINSKGDGLEESELERTIFKSLRL